MNEARPARLPHPRFALGISFALLGAFSLAAQTVLFREHLVVHEGNELGAGIFFCSWLAWVGVGALLSLAAIRRWAGYGRGYVPLLGLYPIAFLVQLLLTMFLRPLAGVEPTDLFPTGTLFAFTFVANVPVSVMTGALFTLAAHTARDSAAEAGGAVSRVYVLECLGAFAGGVGVTIGLLQGWTAISVVTVLAAALAACGWWMALRAARGWTMLLHWFVLIPALAAVLTPGGGIFMSLVDEMRWESRYPGYYLTAEVETPHGRIVVLDRSGQLLVLRNGRIARAWPDGGESLADAALLLSQPGEKRRVALIGSGFSPLLPVMLRYPVERILLLEPDRKGHQFLVEHLPPEATAPLADPRVEIRFGDPRRTLAAAPESFDLVVADVGDPDTALAARLFTLEFYETVRSKLADGGAFATAITSAENYAGTELARYGMSVFATLSAAFGGEDRVRVVPGERAWFLAGRVSTDPAELEARLRGMEVRDRIFEPERIATVLDPWRTEFVRDLYRGPSAEARKDLVSTDDRPQVYLLNLLVLGKRQEAGLYPLAMAIREVGIGVLLLPFFVLLLLRMRYLAARPDRAAARRFGGAWLLVVAGAASLALDLVLLLEYQSTFGLLFEKVGLANGLFMLGLFGGGFVGARITRSWPGVDSAIAAGAALAAATFAFLLPLLWEKPISEAGLLGLFAAAGLLSGLPFPLAAAMLSRSGSQEAATGGVLEAADHFGGAIGAALAGLLLVPLFGAATTTAFLGCLLLSAPALFLAQRFIPRSRPREVRPSFPFVRVSFVLAAVVLSAAAVSWPVRRELDRPLVRLDEPRLRAAVPEARWFEERSKPFLHYRAALDEDRPFVNATLATMAIPVEVSGYGGPLNLLLSIDADSRIRAVRLLESKETPAYIVELPEFLSRFAGRSAERDFRLVGRSEAASPHDLVKITGATVSCRAAVETVNEAKNRMLADLLGKKPPGSSRSLFDPFTKQAIATLLLLLLAVPVYLRGGSKVRTGFLAVVLGVLGVLYNLQLSAGRVAELFTLSLPPLGNLPLFLLVVGALLLAVSFGQVYCGLLCPFGAAQELLGKLGLTREVSRSVDLRARYVKHVVLAVTVTVFLLLGAESVFDFDPLSVVFSFTAVPAMWALVGLLLFLSLFYFRFWCRYLCPVGAFLSLFNRIALLRRFARPKEYGRCDLGVRAGRDLDCIQCNRCLSGAGGRK